ncbi:hypothetical protein LV515_07255 [Limosilactobacillus vaginalis]|nr:MULTISPECIES: restriction endonuclease subunit S [Limosilactobacillus]QFS34656.1 hypothetical protein LV515_07255 [Limosilactobacillus vaginalis]
MTKYRLDQIGKVIGGGTPSTRKKQYYANKGIAWITPKDLSGYSKMYISHGARDISQEGLDNSSAKLLPKDTVLVSSRAPIGYVALAANKITTNQGFKSIVPNTDIVLPKYLYYLMLTKKDELENVSSGSTFKEVSGRVMKGFEVDIPSLDKQANIIQKIEPITRKIELNYQINANLQELRHILYKQLIAQSALKTISIKELYSIKYGKTLPKSQLLRTGTKVFGAKGFMGYTERKPLVNKATVTITSRGSGAGFVSYIDEEEAFLTNNLLYLIDKTGLGLSFTYELIKSSKPSQFVTGSAQPQLTINNLKQLKLKIPTDRFIIEQFKNNTKRIEDCMSNNKIENNSLQKLRLAFLNYYF